MASLVAPGGIKGQSSVSSVADTLEASSVASASPTVADAANAVAIARDGNGGQHTRSYAAADAPDAGAFAEVEDALSAQAAQAQESTAIQHAEHEDRGRSVARMTAMLAQLKAQLKQRAAEVFQLEDMLKQADAQLSSALGSFAAMLVDVV